jgi:hypothetical protein
METNEHDFLPFWAIGRTTTWCVGAQLATRDGRRCGNAVITSRIDDLWEVTTDAGSVLRLLDEELTELFHPPLWLTSIPDSPALLARRRREQHLPTW